jgi:Dickkopf-like protein
MNRPARERVLRVALAVSAFALPLACGGRAVETRNSAATPGPSSAGNGSSVGAANDGVPFGGSTAENGATGGFGSVGGSAELGGSSSTVGGSAALGGASAAGGPSGALPCTHPRPFMSDATGYVQCDDYFYRASKQVCPTTWPRAGEVPGYQPGVSQCRTDADCASQIPLKDAYCALPLDPPPRGTICQAGCLSDSDCLDNYVCLCGDPIGHCIATQCKSDADCIPGMHCASTVDPYACPEHGIALACQLPQDQCTIDAQCAGGFICRIDLNDDGPPWRTCNQQCPPTP